MGQQVFSMVGLGNIATNPPWRKPAAPCTPSSARSPTSPPPSPTRKSSKNSTISSSLAKDQGARLCQKKAKRKAAWGRGVWRVMVLGGGARMWKISSDWKREVLKVSVRNEKTVKIISTVILIAQLRKER